MEKKMTYAEAMEIAAYCLTVSSKSNDAMNAWATKAEAAIKMAREIREADKDLWTISDLDAKTAQRIRDEGK